MMIFSLKFSNISIQQRIDRKTPVDVNPFCSSAATIAYPEQDRWEIVIGFLAFCNIIIT